MTSNSAESVNALSRNARKLPITGLIEFFRDSVQKWYFKRRQLGDKHKGVLTKWAEDKISKRISKCATWTVTGIDDHIFDVTDGGKKGLVDLWNRTCTCRKWQLSGLPCGHVIAVSTFLNQTDCSHWAMNWFRTDVHRATYQETINTVPDQSEWEMPDDFIPLQPPLMDKRMAGRPRNVNRIPSRGEEISPKVCSRCFTKGHHRDQCTAPMPSQSSARSKPRVPLTMTQPTVHVVPENFRDYVIDATGQPTQPFTYPNFDLNEF